MSKNICVKIPEAEAAGEVGRRRYLKSKDLGLSLCTGIFQPYDLGEVTPSLWP